MAPLGPFGWDDVRSVDEVGADLIPLQEKGVPVLGIRQDVTRYFDWHHTAADTFDKVDPTELKQATAAFAFLVAAAANADEK
ncbi:M28 family peptidase, partial [Clostridium perfringens]|uniref:M28 family peptidase n=1 Tax=Clostridium perfringens TaxID=1502 RepID=UPI00375534D2